ncbi:exported protein of unknown function [Methylocella tundrae]|uniref:Uncharacterized protein n=1 Tax=Methylocella tundrae TaxID=227605 RepID=A0A4U8Z2A5_METTU|nr:exported protein of unknown function [Methylocella tundrae]
MIRLLRLAFASLAFAAALAMPGIASSRDWDWHGPGGSHRIEHVFVITLENEGYDVTFGAASKAPYLSQTLKAKGALLTQYFGTGHFSLDNYIAMISGQAATNETRADCQTYADFQLSGMTADGQAIGIGCVYPRTIKTLPDQMRAAGKTWRAYMEDMGAPIPAGKRQPAVIPFSTRLTTHRTPKRRTPKRLEAINTRAGIILSFISIPSSTPPIARPMSSISIACLTTSHLRRRRPILFSSRPIFAMTGMTRLASTVSLAASFRRINFCKSGFQSSCRRLPISAAAFWSSILTKAELGASPKMRPAAMLSAPRERAAVANSRDPISDRFRKPSRSARIRSPIRGLAAIGRAPCCFRLSSSRAPSPTRPLTTILC